MMMDELMFEDIHHMMAMVHCSNALDPNVKEIIVYRKVNHFERF